MSHTVQVSMTANQYIYVGGAEVNIHEIQSIFVSEDGVIEEYTRKPQEQIESEYAELIARLENRTRS